MEARELNTQMTREEGLERLARLADRLQISPREIRVRPTPGARGGVTLTLAVANGTLTKSSTAQPTSHQNFVSLVLWLTDVVRNIERGIETFLEAFYNEGAQQLALRDGSYDGLRPNVYRGDATREDSFELLERSLKRLSLSRADAKLTWNDDGNVAELRIKLRSGRAVAKASSRQADVDGNIHVLALWLQTKAKNYERGLEPDLDALFAANLLPSGS